LSELAPQPSDVLPLEVQDPLEQHQVDPSNIAIAEEQDIPLNEPRLQPVGPVESAPPTEVQEAAPENEKETQLTDMTTEEQERLASSGRISELQQIIDEIANGAEYSSNTKKFLQEGGSIQTAVGEIDSLRGGPPVEKQGASAELPEDPELTSARDQYIKVLRGRKVFGTQKTRTQYESVLAQRVNTQLGIGEESASGQEADPDERMKYLAAHQLNTLTSLLVSERIEVQERLEKAGADSKYAKIMGNKKLRYGMLGVVLASGIASRAGIMPEGLQGIADNVQTAMELTSAFLVTAIHDSKVAKAANKWIDEKREARAAKKQDERTKELVERTLIGTSPDRRTPEARVARTLFDRHNEELQRIAQGGEGAPEEYAAVLQAVVIEQVTQMRREVVTTRAQRVVMRSLSIAGTAVAQKAVIGIAESISYTEDFKEAFVHEDRD
jgi:hypothetical protein